MRDVIIAVVTPRVMGPADNGMADMVVPAVKRKKGGFTAEEGGGDGAIWRVLTSAVRNRWLFGYEKGRSVEVRFVLAMAKAVGATGWDATKLVVIQKRDRIPGNQRTAISQQTNIKHA